MNSNKVKILIIGLLLVVACQSYAQYQTDYANVTLRIPSIALIDIEPDGNNNISFQIDPSFESGLQPGVQEASTQTLWINYTSALPFGQGTRMISAEIATGTLPQGTTLSVEASVFEGIGLGSLGHSQGRVVLDAVPRTLIHSIGNSFTGNGVNNGHSLSFFVDVEDFSKVRAVGQSNLTILYTISDN